jgi:hypothetical protein
MPRAITLFGLRFHSPPPHSLSPRPMPQLCIIPLMHRAIGGPVGLMLRDHIFYSKGNVKIMNDDRRVQRHLELSQMRLQRQALRSMHKEVYEEILKILCRHDPIGICHTGRPRREEAYDPEVGTILPRLNKALSVEDVRRIVYEEFSRWFNVAAGEETKYQQISIEVWEAYHRHDP